jgi:hypothetical protein
MKKDAKSTSFRLADTAVCDLEVLTERLREELGTKISQTAALEIALREAVGRRVKTRRIS